MPNTLDGQSFSFFLENPLYVCLEDRHVGNLEPVLKRLFSGIPYKEKRNLCWFAWEQV